MRTDQQLLQDISEAIGAIRRYTADGPQRFDSDELVRVWCLRHIEVIGEAVSRLSPTIRERYAEVPWRAIVAMRNMLIHGYADVKDDELWNVVKVDLDPLSQSVERILREL